MQQFQQLNEMEKVCTIMEHAKLMTQYMEAGDRIFLYHLDSFYVSACYGTPDDQLKDIQCYSDMHQMLPHIRRQLTAIHPAERKYNRP